MKRLYRHAAAALLLPAAAIAAEPSLFSLSVKDLPAENGKVLDMAFRETSRDPASSTVEIERRSGGSVSSSMFIVRGACGVMTARGERFVVAERMAGTQERYLLTFPATAPAEGKGFSAEQCGMVRQLLRY